MNPTSWPSEWNMKPTNPNPESETNNQHLVYVNSKSKCQWNVMISTYVPDDKALHSLVLGHKLAGRRAVHAAGLALVLLVAAMVAAFDGHLEAIRRQTIAQKQTVSTHARSAREVDDTRGKRHNFGFTQRATT